MTFEAVGLLATFFGLLVLRQNIILILICVTAYIHFFWGDGDIGYLLEDLWDAVSKETLLAIPMFVICGSIMTRGSIAQRLVNIMVLATRWLPGGLAVATIVSCAVFAAISGSSGVTMLAVGAIMYPILLKQGYDKKFALGALAAGGTLGIVIPPSIPMILFGIVNEKSVVDMFIGGIIPGLMLTGVMSIYALYRNRSLPAKPFVISEFIQALQKGIWSMLLPFILLGGIYTGWFSATESAAVALAYALLVEIFIHRELKPIDFYHTTVETAKILGTLFPIVAIAISINGLLTVERVPQELADWLLANVDSKITFLLALNVFLLIVGCFVDIASAILILSPMLLPAAQAYGIHPIHFGIIMVVNLEIGFLTPPIGLNLIVAMTAFKENFGLICRSVIPFIVLMFGVLMIVAFVPETVLYLVER